MNTYEQENLFSAPADAEASAADAFGCCSRYRACSDAKICLIGDQEYSKNCLYRKSLESGRIFYGKNAIAYRPNVYQEFVSRYLLLSPKEVETLYSIFDYFFLRKVGASSVMYPDTPELF